jgi:hypothetical protein
MAILSGRSRTEPVARRRAPLLSTVAEKMVHDEREVSIRDVIVIA